MSFLKGKTSNKTVMILSLFSLMIFASVILSMLFESIPVLLTGIGAGLAVIIFSIINLAETYLEPARDFEKTFKSKSGMINTFISALSIFYGIVLIFTGLNITGVTKGMVIVVLSIQFLSTARELLFD